MADRTVTAIPIAAQAPAARLEPDAIGVAQDTVIGMASSAPAASVALTLAPPPGAAVPSSFPALVNLSGGQATIAVSFPSAGYWRIAASGPAGSRGWVTVDVGVTPDTAP